MNRKNISMLARNFLLISSLALSTLALPAAEITWGTPQNVTAEADISTNGTLVEAVNASVQSTFTDATVNGVLFEGKSLLSARNFGGDFDPDGSSNLTGGYAQLMSDADFGGGTDTTITVGGGNLLIGAEYELQVWFLDRRSSVSDRVMTFSDRDEAATSVDLNGDIGQFATGTFVADRTSQSLRLRTNGFGNAHINAYQLRLLTPSLEVTTLADEFDDPAGTDLSLREALRDANPGDLITFNSPLNGGVIQLDPTLGELVIDKSLTITASNLTNGIIIDGGSNGDDNLDPGETRCLMISDENFNNQLTVSLNHLTFQNGVFKATDFGEGGGNIFNEENLTLNDCRILHGLLLGPDPIFDEGDDEFSTPASFGGGLFSDRGTLTLNSCLVSHNRTLGDSADGGGIAALDNNLILTACTISENSTSGAFATGGGISSRGDDLILTNCTIDRNQTFGEQADGGGILSQNRFFSMSNSTVSRNQTFGLDAPGGGLRFVGNFQNVRASLLNSTIAANESRSATGGAVGISVGIRGYDFEHCTIVGNSAVEGTVGGIVDLFGNGSIDLRDSIVRDNGSGLDLGIEENRPNTVSTFTFSGDNLIGSVDPRISGIVTNSTPILLALLADYGGPTETMSPVPGSPAIDGATTSTVAVDQRGFEVSDGLPDIGAVEFQGDFDELFFNQELINSDFDQDGLSVGLEFAIGTDPFVADFDNPRRPRMTLVDGQPTLIFGLGFPSEGFFDNDFFFEIRVERSETLEPGSFEEVVAVESFEEEDVFIDDFGPESLVVEQVGDQIIITDTSAAPKAFYRLRGFLSGD